MATNLQHLTLFPRLAAPCRQCRQQGLAVSATIRQPDQGTMMMMCDACGHVEFASVPTRDMRLLVDLAAVMQGEWPAGIR